MRDVLVYEVYSENRDFRFEVYREKNYFEVWVQRKITDEYMGPDWFDYHDIADHKHMTDTLDKAIEIGRESLNALQW